MKDEDMLDGRCGGGLKVDEKKRRLLLEGTDVILAPLPAILPLLDQDLAYKQSASEFLF